MDSPIKAKNTKYSPTRIASSLSRRLVEVVKGPSAHFENQVYIDSRNHQLGVLFSGVSPESFRGKTVLEVGCGHGHLGAELENLGAQVTSTDARAGNIKQLRKKFPNRNASVCDACSPELENLGTFDIVFAFGLLYHLPCPSEFLAACSRIADTLLMETVVTNAAEPEIIWRQETRVMAFYDQTIHGGGCRPSLSWVERELSSNGYGHIVDLCADEEKWNQLDAPTYQWRWTGTGGGESYGDEAYRRIWFASKNEPGHDGSRILL